MSQAVTYNVCLILRSAVLFSSVSKISTPSLQKQQFMTMPSVAAKMGEIVGCRRLILTTARILLVVKIEFGSASGTSLLYRRPFISHFNLDVQGQIPVRCSNDTTKKLEQDRIYFTFQNMSRITCSAAASVGNFSSFVFDASTGLCQLGSALADFHCPSGTGGESSVPILYSLKPGFNPFLVLEPVVTFGQAKLDCEAKGSRMAMIKTAQELNYVLGNSNNT